MLFRSRIVALFSGSTGTDEESLRKELKKITSGVTDSDFLLQLKGKNDKDLISEEHTSRKPLGGGGLEKLYLASLIVLDGTSRGYLLPRPATQYIALGKYYREQHRRESEQSPHQGTRIEVECLYF